IMLSHVAVALLRDVLSAPELLAGARPITRRIVRWGNNAPTLELDHAAVVVSERELLAQLEQVAQAPETSNGAGDFTIFASRPLPPPAAEHGFGSRRASTARIRLKDACDSKACCMESIENGWLFMLPDEAESGWLLTVGCGPQEALAQSQLIA